MLKRTLIIGSATALAALVLFLAMRADPAARPTPRKTITTPLDPSAFTGIDPDVGASGGAGGGGGGGVSPFNPRGQADKYRITRHTGSGQLIEFFGDRITPRPKGVADVTAPGTRIHLERYRVLQITADYGTIVAPDNQPRSGRFTGNVVITLFESHPSLAVDLSPDSPDIALRAYLGDSRFDLELGIIESNDHVHVTNPQLDFRGTGLTLSYNEQQRRIDRLEIHQGRSLRFKPETHATLTQAQPKNGQPKTSPPHDPGVQRYRASFTQRVHIKTPQATIDADRFDVVFTFNPQSRRDRTAHNNTPTTTTHALTPIPAKHPATVAFALFAAATAGVAADAPIQPQSMAPVGPDDIIITWSGPLIVKPEPDTLADPKDVLLELTGQPLRITTPQHDQITAAKLDYQTSQGRLRAYADPRHRIEVTSPTLGHLTAQQLTFSQTDDTARIIGPATLVVADTPAMAGMKIRWQDNLDLAFAPQNAAANTADTANGANPFARFAALASADFNGQVRLTKPDLDLDCDHLTLAIDNTPNLPPAPKIIQARGAVHLTARDSPDQDQPLGVKADQLQIFFTRDADHRAQPDRILATGPVDAQHQGRRIRAQKLQLIFDPAAPDTTDPTRNVQSITADHSVRIDIDNPPITATAEHLLADLKNDQIELTADPVTQAQSKHDTPPIVIHADPLGDWPIDPALNQTTHPPTTTNLARVAFEQGNLQARHIVIHHRSESLHVPGPGTLTFTAPNDQPTRDLKPATTPTATLIEKAIAASLKPQPPTTPEHPNPPPPPPPPPPPSPNDTPNPITLRWDRAMHIDNRSGVAQFYGNVHLRSATGHDTTELTAQELRLEFTDQPKTTNTAPTPIDHLATGSRTIRTATARQNVVLITQRFDHKNPDTPPPPHPPPPPQTRLRLQGQHLVFDHTAEQAQILGPGSLLFEDYRTDKTSPRNTKANAPRIEMTGKGPTLFQWSTQMTLDAVHNDIELLGNVQMLHRPADQKEPIQLDCQRLLADLTPTGGLPSWLTKQRRQPAIQSIRADTNVRLTASDRSVQTDHLVYTGHDHTVLLSANPGRLTRLHAENEPYVHTAQALRWNLATDRIEIDHPTTSQIPITR